MEKPQNSPAKESIRTGTSPETLAQALGQSLLCPGATSGVGYQERLVYGHGLPDAVHAGMAGKTGMIVGNWNHQGTRVPISLAVSQRKKLDLDDWI